MEDACLGTIADGTVTHDLGGSASTTAFTDAVIKKIYQLS
ncbi:3-isopropylmalate dehydrogenase [Heyndrickxia coagulans]|nr:isocitrate/isopropylmalate dehydrogenase [Heyndrickxia coagulans]AKN55427.1 3-isopropylmalate dehydrogenase [Heyndrickxia coagulans]